MTIICCSCIQWGGDDHVLFMYSMRWWRSYAIHVLYTQQWMLRTHPCTSWIFIVTHLAGSKPIFQSKLARKNSKDNLEKVENRLQSPRTSKCSFSSVFKIYKMRTLSYRTCFMFTFPTLIQFSRLGFLAFCMFFQPGIPTVAPLHTRLCCQTAIFPLQTVLIFR